MIFSDSFLQGGGIIPIKTKIKITDNSAYRAKLEQYYEKVNQVDLSKWSLMVAKHILEVAGIDYRSHDALADGFAVNELWQDGKATVHEVRQAGLAIHKAARESGSEIEKTALRAAGQAVSSGHMREHAMVASDYAVKTIGLLSGNNLDAITAERQWQLAELIKFTNL